MAARKTIDDMFAEAPAGVPRRVRRSQHGPNPMRSFDPRRVGELECEMWVAYYRREWGRLLRGAVLLVHHAFGLRWPSTLRGAWLLLRANQRWAPPHNDPDGARRAMRGFYALVAARHGERFDVEQAAWLDVDWWRAHREGARDPGGVGEGERAVTVALVALYSHVYGVQSAAVRLAAEQRALAMRYSDAWVSEGCPAASGLVEAECAALVRSYAALLAAVHVT